jgi:hypothetical protein
MLIELDFERLHHNYYPVPQAEISHTLVLPSMEDAEADLWIEGERRVWEDEWE